MYRVLFLVLLYSSIASGLPVGVAKVDITPDYPIRLSGYAVRKTQSDGVEQHLFTKALALGDDKNLTLLITVDITGMPVDVVEQIAADLHEKAHIARERL